MPALNRAVHDGTSCMFPNEPAQSHCQHHPSCVACVHLTTIVDTMTHPSCAVCVHVDVAGADDWEHFTIGGKDYLVSALATGSIASPGVMRTRKQLGIATSIKRPMSTSFHASFSMSIAIESMKS